jgi:hypothetical protein
MVSGKTKPPHYLNQISLWSSKTTTLLKYQWEMVSGQPKKPPHEESKAQYLIPSTNFKKLLTFHLTRGDTKYQ